MKEYDDTNRGALFDQEPQSDRHPTMTGSLNVEGREYWVSGWHKTSKQGRAYVSLSVRPKDQPTMGGQSARGRKPRQERTNIGELDDDLPF